MFTGIVEEIGHVRHVLPGSRAGRITIAAHTVLEGSRIGDSICVNGVCLTVTSLGADEFSADVMPETLSRSNLGALRTGDPVDLERAMPADGRFGGHIVSGHIDGTGTISKIQPDENATWVTVSCAPGLLRYIVEKGSIAIDGVSLTVAGVTGSDFSVSIIPHTGEATVLTSKRTGAVVNLECDIIGKYVERLLFGGAGCTPGSPDDALASSPYLSGRSGPARGQAGKPDASGGPESTSGSGGLTLEYLREHGF